jgi:hypothetical protein
MTILEISEAMSKLRRLPDDELQRVSVAIAAWLDRVGADSDVTGLLATYRERLEAVRWL